jgi:hypothetical protein
VRGFKSSDGREARPDRPTATTDGYHNVGRDGLAVESWVPSGSRDSWERRHRRFARPAPLDERSTGPANTREESGRPPCSTRRFWFVATTRATWPGRRSTIGRVDEFVPRDFEVPRRLETPQFVLEPLGPEHNDQDYDAWTSSGEHIHTTPGWQDSNWPREMTPDENRTDLQRHADDFRNRKGFTYTVLDPASREVISIPVELPREPIADLEWCQKAGRDLGLTGAHRSYDDSSVWGSQLQPRGLGRPALLSPKSHPNGALPAAP